MLTAFEFAFNDAQTFIEILTTLYSLEFGQESQASTPQELWLTMHNILMVLHNINIHKKERSHR